MKHARFLLIAGLFTISACAPTESDRTEPINREERIAQAAQAVQSLFVKQAKITQKIMLLAAKELEKGLGVEFPRTEEMSAGMTQAEANVPEIAIIKGKLETLTNEELDLVVAILDVSNSYSDELLALTVEEWIPEKLAVLGAAYKDRLKPFEEKISDKINTLFPSIVEGNSSQKNEKSTKRNGQDLHGANRVGEQVDADGHIFCALPKEEAPTVKVKIKVEQNGNDDDQPVVGREGQDENRPGSTPPVESEHLELFKLGFAYAKWELFLDKDQAMQFADKLSKLPDAKNVLRKYKLAHDYATSRNGLRFSAQPGWFNKELAMTFAARVSQMADAETYLEKYRSAYDYATNELRNGWEAAMAFADHSARSE